jgi:hypothetical protein
MYQTKLVDHVITLMNRHSIFNHVIIKAVTVCLLVGDVIDQRGSVSRKNSCF